MFGYQLKPESDVPVYRQLADQIHAEIRSGALKTGTQLPTVREMAEKTHLSCGTVKRVYDRLRELGDIDMTRRRGSFVKYVRNDTDSRKLMAMNAIDDMLRRLSELNFSPREIQIFLNLKLREWGVSRSGVRIGIVTPGEEITGDFEAQLAVLGNVHVLVSNMTRMREYPYMVDEECDVLLCTEEDAPSLRALLPDDEKLIPVALTPGRGLLVEAVALGGANTAVVCSSHQFARSVEAYLPRGCRIGFDEVPEGADALIVPPGYAGNAARARLEEMRDRGRCVEMRYEIDVGSLLYLKERIGRLREERQLRPVAMDFRSAAE